MLVDVMFSDTRDGEGSLMAAEPLVGLSSTLGEVAATVEVTAGLKTLIKSPFAVLIK